ncbi:ATP-binding protein [Christensenellaceae bacterium OttesenSCG-928-K19]|nr:ATP-binding protein [Christensenellaceae bacterium OttesenSCG-928-K19]
MAKRNIADVFSDFRSNSIAAAHRYEQACAQNSDLAAIREQIQQAGLAKLECALTGKSEQPYDIELERLAAREKEILQSQVAAPRYRCEACRDTGAIGSEYCTCLLDLLYLECYNAVDIESSPISFNTFDFSVYEDEVVLPNGRTQRQWAELFVKHAKKYVDDFPKTSKQNILISGKAGLGKSYLMYAMAKYAKQRGIDTLLMRANDMFSLFHAHRMGEEIDLAYMHGAKLLLVDDIGTEPITQNVSNEYFYDLIDRRLRNGLHTVFATNVNDLQKRYDDRISSRLQSDNDCLQFFFDGQDLRIDKS